MDIYTIKELLLQAKPKSTHHLNRYIKLIQYAIEHPTKEKKFDKHHILPKSMFPEYKSFSNHPWNKIKLSKRQHFIAHHLLWKAFRNQQMTCAFWYMSNVVIDGENKRLTSRTYAQLREDLKIQWTDEKKKSLSEKMSGEGNPMYGRHGKDNPSYGQKRNSHSLKMKEYYGSPQNRERTSILFKAMWSDKNFREKMINTKREVYSTDEYKNKISKIRKATWEDSEYRRKQELKWTDEARLIASERQSQLSSALWKTEEYKELISNARKETWKNPEYRKRELERRCKFLYDIFFQNGEIVETDNIIEFAQKHGYSKSCLYQVLNGNRKYHKDIIKITKAPK